MNSFSDERVVETSWPVLFKAALKRGRSPLVRSFMQMLLFVFYVFFFTHFIAEVCGFEPSRDPGL